MKKKFVFIWGVLLLLIMFIFTGCSMKSADRQKKLPTPDMAKESDTSVEMKKDDLENNFNGSDEKIISYYNMSFESTEFDKSKEQILEAVKRNGAFIDHSSISYDQNNYKYSEGSSAFRVASFTIRSDRNKSEGFIKDLKSSGVNLIDETITKQNFTTTYKDLESRLNIVNKKEERLIALMDKAQNMSDMIEIEKSLSETIGEKENIKNQMQNINTDVKYDTFQLNLQEVKQLSNKEGAKTSFLTRIGYSIKNMGYFYWVALQNMLIVIIYLLPIIIISLFIFLMLRRRILAKRKSEVLAKNDGIKPSSQEEKHL